MLLTKIVKGGVDIIDQIKTHYPHIQVLIFSAIEDPDFIFPALKAGAGGYIVRNGSYFTILDALKEISAGEAPLSRKIIKMILNSYHLNSTSILTKREREILQLTSEGKTYVEVSEILNISKFTAKTHIRNIFEKLQVRSKSEAIAKARHERLI